ncbi:SCAN domain-containing protein 3-like [Palaemon carinicauda]|uniref:SCAN domain-containing protein 3-like n=1 Tax=Palaemon carinicauda TaxID=392227 RepID=UPI0035B65FD4
MSDVSERAEEELLAGGEDEDQDPNVVEEEDAVPSDAPVQAPEPIPSTSSALPTELGQALSSIVVMIQQMQKENSQKAAAMELQMQKIAANSSVSRRIDEMAEDVEKQLISHLQVKQFTLQLDESTLRDNEAILLPYIRFNSDEGHKEEILFARSLVTDTKGETIFNEVVTYFQQNNIPLKNIIAFATDDAPSMTGRYKGFIVHSKKALPEVFCIHCVLHRQHLVAKKLSAHLHEALTIVVQVVNHIKSNSLRDRLFHESCKQNGEEFERLVLHTEVRWLSKGNCLQRFIALWDSIVSFLANTQLVEQLLANKCDVFFLSDIFENLNSLNKQLQGKDYDLISSGSAIVAFLRKLQLYKNNIRLWRDVAKQPPHP